MGFVYNFREMGSHTVLSSDGTAIHYVVQGSGRPALVFIHGWCSDTSYWREQIPQFQKKYEVIALDLAGHGESDLNRKKWTMRSFGEDAAAVIDKLDLDQVILIGHSMGGNAALETARIRPDRVIGIIGADTLLNFEFTFPKQEIDEFVDGFRKDFKMAAKEYIQQAFVQRSDPSLVEKVADEMSLFPPEIGISVMKCSLDYMSRELIKAVRKLNVPITCINSDFHDTDVEINRKYIPSFNVKSMTGVGHFPMLEDPSTFNGLLDEAIREMITRA
jgi:pimeloyl-ACP methyl ester carboxylesterase